MNTSSQTSGLTFGGQVRLVASIRSLDERPRWNLLEIAVIGRSNAGKSSIINALLGTKGLARVGKTPGRTQTLNFYSVGDRFALVDLPGYGYAKISKTQALELATLLYRYLEHDQRLSAALLVVDSRRAPSQEERSITELMARREITTILAANKSDKLTSSERKAALERWASLGVKIVLCSALNGEGIALLRKELVAIVDKSRRSGS